MVGTGIAWSWPEQTNVKNMRKECTSLKSKTRKYSEAELKIGKPQKVNFLLVYIVPGKELVQKVYITAGAGPRDTRRYSLKPNIR